MTYASNRHRLALLTSVAILSSGSAWATDYSVGGGTTSSTQITAADTDTVTLGEGSTLSVNNTAIRWDSPSTDLQITNNGTIESTETGGRAINAGGSATSPRVLTLTNNAGAVISAQNDAIRINTDITSGSVTLINAGTIISTVNGQAIDFDAVASTPAGAITIANQATGIIQSTDADALRPGAGAIVTNYGLISAGKTTNTSSDGIDWQSHTGTVLNEAGGTITGGRHGITGDVDVQVTNYGTITGLNGSGIGSDGTGTITNYGRITGTKNGLGNSDGDGVDIDYYGVIYNFGTIEGLGAEGGPVDYPHSSEGIAMTGGGIVYNGDHGVITGIEVGLSAYNNFTPSNTTQITNWGTIYGGNHGVGGNGETSVLNYGTISGGIIGLDVLTSPSGPTAWTIDNYGSIEGVYASMLVQSGSSAVLKMQSGGSLSGVILLRGSLDFQIVADFTFADGFDGEGHLTKSGAGVLNLTGTAFHTGGTIVNGGTLKGTALSLKGPILNNATLEFDQSVNGTYSYSITGSGSLVKSGAGTLTLTGNNAFTGITTVAGGTLAVNGSLTSGPVIVANNGTLGGSGTIIGSVSVANGGTLSPGQSAGTLTVNGNLTLSSGANTVLEVDGPNWSASGGRGSYDRLIVNGTFTAAGTLTGNFRDIAGDATNAYTPALGTRYTVVTANSVTGTFDHIIQGSGDLAIRLDPLYFSNTIELVVTPSNFVSFGTARGWRSNALAAGRAFETVRSDSGSAPVLRNLYGLDEAGYDRTFSQMSGEIYANALQGLGSAARTTLRVVRDQAVNVTADGMDGSTVQLWSRFIHTRENPKASAKSDGYSANTDGIMAGLMLISEQDLRLGVAGGYTETNVHNGLGETAKGSGVVAYAYAAFTPNARLDVTAIGGFSSSTLNAKRTVTAQAVTTSATAKARSLTVQFTLDARFLATQFGKLSLYGLGGVEAGRTRSSRINERASNDTFALTLPRDYWNTIDAKLGGEAVLRLKGVNLSAYGTGLFQIGDSATASRHVELATAKWEVRSTDVARSGISYGTSASAQITPHLSLQASYDGADRGKGYHNDRFSAGIGMVF